MDSKLKIVVLGAGGRLGAALVREYASQHEVTGFRHAQLDLARLEVLRAMLEPLSFDVLINAAALTNVDYCEDHRAEAMRLNAEAPRVLAEICREKDRRFIHVSTDYVFDGKKREPYAEEDQAHAISVYGESKREGELRVLETNSRALVIRVSWVFGPDRPSFVDAILNKARTEEQVVAVADKFSTPTYTQDITAMLRPLFDSSGVGRDSAPGKSGSVQLAGICAVGARLLPSIRRTHDGENGRRGIVRRNEKLPCSTARLYGAGNRKV